MTKKITGVAIAPGISKNRKKYTRENIAKAVTRMQARIDDGTHPIVMRTHHGAGDDSTAIVARVTGVSQATDGAAIYEAVIQDTTAGNDIAAMIPDKPGDKTKGLAHVSIWGGWVGKPKKLLEGGEWVEYADDFEIDKLDFTATPGVTGTTATVESWEPSDDPGILAESVRPVMFSDHVDLAEADVNAPSLVSVNVCGSAGGFDLSVNAWCIPASEIDAWADTAQRALAAAIGICEGGPVDDDADAAGESTGKPDDSAMESHELPAAEAVAETENRKESTMDNEVTKPEGAEIAESTEAPLTAESIATALVGALKAAGVIAETTPEGENQVAETDVKSAEGETAPTATSGLSEADMAKIRADVLASIVANGEVKPTRKGFGLAETSDASVDDAYNWDNRGEKLVEALTGMQTAAVTEDEGAA